MLLPILPALAGVRVAVVGGPALGSAGDAAVVALSREAGIELVERDELSRIIEEQKFQAAGIAPGDALRLGRLANADAILFLEQLPTGGDRLTAVARLVAVGPGVVLASWRAALPMADAEGWGAIIARESRQRLQAFSTPALSRVAVSLLAVRGEGGGFASAERERDFAALLGQRLLHEPGLLVLERWDLDQLAWEKQLASAPPGTFAGGSVVVEVSLNLTGGFQATARLRMAADREGAEVRAQGTDLASLAGSLGGEIARRMGRSPLTQAWEPQAEAATFLEQARWGIRTHSYAQAAEAAEICWTLGLRTEEVGLLRAVAAAQVPAWEFRMAVNQMEAKMPSIEELRSGLRPVVRFAESRRVLWGDRPMPATWITAGTDCLSILSRCIRLGFYAKNTTPEEMELLAEMREEARRMATDLTASAQATPDGFVRDGKTRFVEPDSIEADIWNIGLVRLIFAPLYGETPEQSRELLTAAYEDVMKLPLELRARMKARGLSNREANEPLVAAWRPADASRVEGLVSQFTEPLLRHPRDPEKALDGASAAAQRYTAPLVDLRLRPYPMEAAQKAVSDLRRMMYWQPDAVPERRMHWMQLEGALDQLSHAANSARNYRFETADFRTNNTRFLLLKTFLARRWKGPAEAYGRLIYSADSFNAAQIAELEQLTTAFLAADPKAPRFLRYHLEGYAAVTKDTHREEVIAPPAGPPPAFVWRMPEEWRGGYVNHVLWRDGRFWVVSSAFDHWGRTSAIRVAAIDPTDWSTKTVPLFRTDSTIPFTQPMFDVADGRLFVLTDNSVAFCDFPAGQWATIPLPDLRTARLWVVGRSLIISGHEGVIVRIKGGAPEPEILASSRRRPARTILDDIGLYEINEAFPDVEGRLCVGISGHGTYRYDEKNANWTQLPGRTTPPPTSVPRPVAGVPGSRDIARNVCRGEKFGALYPDQDRYIAFAPLEPTR